MRRPIDDAKDLSGRLTRMQEDARDLVAELRRIADALGTAGGPEPDPAHRLARVVYDRRDTELFEELARAMSMPGGQAFLHRR